MLLSQGILSYQGCRSKGRQESSTGRQETIRIQIGDCHGTCDLFVMEQPLTGWRHMAMTDRRASEDCAHQMKALVDEHFADAEVIRVVLDSLIQIIITVAGH